MIKIQCLINIQVFKEKPQVINFHCILESAAERLPVSLEWNLRH